MSTYVFHDGPDCPEQISELAVQILADALKHPPLREIVQQMVNDETVTREQLFCTAFTQGVVTVLGHFCHGRMVVSRPEDN